MERRKLRFPGLVGRPQHLASGPCGKGHPVRAWRRAVPFSSGKAPAFRSAWEREDFDFQFRILLARLEVRARRSVRSRIAIENLKSEPPCRRWQRSTGRFEPDRACFLSFDPEHVWQPKGSADAWGLNT